MSQIAFATLPVVSPIVVPGRMDVTVWRKLLDISAVLTTLQLLYDLGVFLRCSNSKLDMFSSYSRVSVGAKRRVASTAFAFFARTAQTKSFRSDFPASNLFRDNMDIMHIQSVRKEGRHIRIGLVVVIECCLSYALAGGMHSSWQTIKCRSLLHPCTDWARLGRTNYGKSSTIFDASAGRSL